MTDDASREVLLLEQEVRGRRSLRGVVNSITHTRAYEYAALASNLAVVGVGSGVAAESLMQGNPIGAALGAAFATYSMFTLQDIAGHMGERAPEEERQGPVSSRED